MFPWRRTALRRRVVINLKSDKAIAGVLVAKRGRLLIVKGAELFEGRDKPTRVDGEVVILLADVDFIQVLPEA